MNGELWLGINAIHRLTVDVSLRNDMMAADNSKAYAKYDEFSIANAKSKNVIYFGRYSGTACDALKVYKVMKFSTHDQDNDTHRKNCAVEFGGAWWYVNCYDSNLNGEYTCGRSGQHLVVWEHFQGTKTFTESGNETEMIQDRLHLHFRFLHALFADWRIFGIKKTLFQFLLVTSLLTIIEVVELLCKNG